MAKYVKFKLALLVLIIILILVFYHITYNNCQITVPPRYYNILYLPNLSHNKPVTTTNKPVTTTSKPVTTTNPYKQDNQNIYYSIPDLWVSYRDKWLANKVLVKIAQRQVILDSNYQLAMHNKGYHPLVRSNERFRARLDRFYRYCSTFDTKNGNKLSFELGYYQMLFNDKYELLQCVTQKVASSQWVRIFISLYGEKPEDYFNRASPIGGDDILWKKISLNFNLNNDTITSKRFQTYTKILIVRHPFAKILSAYKDKFNGTSWWYIEIYAPQIIKVNHLNGFATNENEFRRLNQSKKYGLTKQREEFVLNQIRRLKPNELSEYRITFHEFLVYLVAHLEKNRLAMDPHWGLISLYCNPCSVIYDVIAKYETLFEDTSDILQYLSSKSNHTKLDEIVKANVQPYATTEVCNNEFRAIPLWLKRKLYMVYREDFLMFGYPYDESLLQDHACSVN